MIKNLFLILILVTSPLFGFEIYEDSYFKLGFGTWNGYSTVSPELIDNKIYFASVKGKIATIDLKTGKEKKIKELKTEITTDVASDGINVFVGDSRKTFFAVDIDSKKIKWKLELDSKLSGRAIFDDEVVVVTSVLDTIYCIDRNSGAKLWEIKNSYVSDNTNIEKKASGVIYKSQNNKYLYIPTKENLISKIDIKTGKEVKVFEFEKTDPTLRVLDMCADLKIVGNNIYFAGYNTQSGVFSTKNDLLKWTKPSLNFIGLDVDEDNKHFVSSEDSYLVCRDTDSGKEKWRSGTRGILTKPVIRKGKVYVSDNLGNITAFSLENGKEVFNFDSKSIGFASELKIYEDIIFAICRDGIGYIYKIEE
jgi:outer membrane protein assembly factor BamB